MWLNGDGFYLGEEKRERNCATGRHRSGEKNCSNFLVERYGSFIEMTDCATERHRSGEKNCSNFLVQPALSLFNRQFSPAEIKKKKEKKELIVLNSEGISLSCGN